MMTRMQAIFFSDYRLIENFLHDCSDDVNKLSCGRLQTEEDEEVCFYDCLAYIMEVKKPWLVLSGNCGTQRVIKIAFQIPLNPDWQFDNSFFKRPIMGHSQILVQSNLY